MAKNHNAKFNPNLGGSFSSSIEGGGVGGGGGSYPSPCLKLVKIMLETSYLPHKYTDIQF